MTIRKQRQQGLELTPENIQGGGGNDLTREGEISTDSSDSELKVRLNAATRTVVTEDQTQVLTNKTIDADLNTIADLEVDNLKAGVLNVSTTLSGASDTQIPSALAVLTYVDNKAAAQNEASEITVVPAGTIAATNVQAALEELDGDIQGHITDATDAHDASAISNIPAGNLAATDVQAALNELQGDIDTNASGLSNHLSDAVDAHDASAISNVPSGNLAATDVQGALNELQTDIDGLVDGPASATDNAVVRFDGTSGAIVQNSVVTISDTGVIAGASINADTNAITNIENADIKSGAAIDAAKIADGSVSNAEFQYLDGVTSAIQTQINSKQSTLTNSAGLAAALSDETGTGLVVFNSAPTITGASIQTPSRLDAKQDTLANLFTYALTATNGQFVWATDTKETYVVKDNTLSAVGGGSSGLGDIFQLTASEQITDWATGDNATFLGGGTLAGTFVKETSTPLNGTASYKYTQAASSLDDYLAAPVKPVPVKFRGQQTFLTFPFQYNGNTSDIRIIIYDVTNSAIISSTTDVVQGTNGGTSSAIVGVIIPLTCANIRVGFHVKTLNSGKVFSFDDIQLSTDIYSISNVANITNFQSYTPTGTWVANTTYTGSYRILGDSLNVIARITLTGAPTGSFSLNLPSGYTIDYTKMPAGTGTDLEALGSVNILISGVRYQGSVATNSNSSIRINTDNAGGNVNATIPATFNNGSAIELQFIVPIKESPAYIPSVVVPNQQVSSDTIAFVFKSTAIVDTDPIGTFNTYTYALNSNTPTISGSAPTQTVSSMNTDGIQIFGRAYTANSTTGSPARVDIFVGKGLKSLNLNAFSASGKSAGSELSIDVRPLNATGTTVTGCEYTYSELTGILRITGGQDTSLLSTTRNIGIKSSDATAATSGYFVFNAAKLPSITALPLLQPRIATLSDVKTSGTSGGSASAATTQTRTLNTIVDSTGIVTSLSSNQFTLAAGTYYIDVIAPAGGVNSHKARLRNITDSSTTLIGTTEYSAVSSQFSQNPSFIKGEVTITSSKTFEIQHYTTTARATDGFGTAVGNGESELYTIVKLLKIK